MDKSTERLLRESIKASDRTTHAVRAFVYFLFLQLTFATIALFLWFIATGDPLDPIAWLQWTSLFVWVFGVVISSWVGWSELKASDVPIEAGSVGDKKELAIDHEPEIQSPSPKLDLTPVASKPGSSLGVDRAGRIVCVKCGVWEMVDDGRCLACDA